MQDGIAAGESNDSSAGHVPTSNTSVSLNQEQLDDLIRRKHNDAYEKGKSHGAVEAESRLRGELEAKIQEHLDPEKLRHLMAEHHEKLTQEHQRELETSEANKIIHSFMHKMNEGESPNPDMDELVKNLNLQKIPHIVQLADESPHTKRIMYDLVENPEKMTKLVMLAHLDENLARHHMKKLTESIETNVKAQPLDVKQPLKQVQPSNIGSDSGKLSVSQLRRQQHLMR